MKYIWQVTVADLLALERALTATYIVKSLCKPMTVTARYHYEKNNVTNDQHMLLVTNISITRHFCSQSTQNDRMHIDVLNKIGQALLQLAK